MSAPLYDHGVDVFGRCIKCGSVVETSGGCQCQPVESPARRIERLERENAALLNLLSVAEPMDGIETLRVACVEARAALNH